MFAFSLQRRARVAADAPPATPPTITIVKFCFVICFSVSMPLFRGSCLGTHCTGGSSLPNDWPRQEPPVQCVPGLEPWNEN